MTQFPTQTAAIIPDALAAVLPVAGANPKAPATGPLAHTQTLTRTHAL